MADTAQLHNLKQQLETAPLQPATLDLAVACLQQNPTAAVVQPILAAARTIAQQRNPQAALDYAHLCQQACPGDRAVLVCLFYLHQQMHQHGESIALADQIADLAQTPAAQIYAGFLQLRSRLVAGGHWDEVFAIAAQQEQLILTLTETTPAPLERGAALELAGASFFFPYIRDALAENRQVQNHLMQWLQTSVQTYARERYDRFRQGLAARRTQPRNPAAPLRVGYLSKCLQQHSVGWLSRWLIQHHDRQRVQVYGYLCDYYPDPQDELQTWFLSHLDQARTFERAGLKVADAIFEDAIDILVDLDSATAEHTFEILALKPAPVQVTWLGWDALGMSTVDYFIADPWVLPEDANPHYAEKLWRLPQTYLAVDGFEVGVPSLRREDLGIPADAIVCEPALRQQISAKLWRSRQTASLWNARQFTRNLEQAYAQMWAAYWQSCQTSNSTPSSQPETPAMTPLNLHIGGQEPHPAWKILDIESRPEVDYVGDAADLSQFADNSIDTIYASHVLEHFHYALNDELLRTLREWHRVLKPSGRLMVSVPDLKILCWLYLNPNLEPLERHHLMRIMFGGQTNPYDIHRVGFDVDTLGLYFWEAGFQHYERVTEFNLFNDCSQIRILDTLISLNMIATK
jgi:predicted O-linked N-acetylglucosamine transferase (SPINDLY family)/predicted SAM-dependent methyltransferase